ncbi:MAG: hypothetical protein EBZ60_08515, partial [Betaproteobacteria bacterium]|nr:hypothetical protein [Betaproteobacteria bacterium]
DPERIRLLGSYPASCGERSWPLAYADPASHSRRAVAAMWQMVSGAQALGGTVREGTVPPDLRPLFQWESAPLGELIRDINKFSNNVSGVAGFVHSPGGKTLVLVALVNSPQVSGANARAWFDVLVDWSAQQADRQGGKP